MPRAELEAEVLKVAQRLAAGAPGAMAKVKTAATGSVVRDDAASK